MASPWLQVLATPCASSSLSPLPLGSACVVVLLSHRPSLPRCLFQVGHVKIPRSNRSSCQVLVVSSFLCLGPGGSLLADHVPIPLPQHALWRPSNCQLCLLNLSPPNHVRSPSPKCFFMPFFTFHRLNRVLASSHLARRTWPSPNSTPVLTTLIVIRAAGTSPHESSTAASPKCLREHQIRSNKHTMNTPLLSS